MFQLFQITFFPFRWDDSFYAGGICIAISGFLAYIIGSVKEAEVAVDEDDVNNNDDMDDRRKIAQRN